MADPSPGTPLHLKWDTDGEPPEWWVVHGHGQAEAAVAHARDWLWDWSDSANHFDDLYKEGMSDEVYDAAVRAKVDAWPLPTRDGWTRWLNPSTWEEAENLGLTVGLSGAWTRRLMWCGPDDPGAFPVTLAHDGEQLRQEADHG